MQWRRESQISNSLIRQNTTTTWNFLISGVLEDVNAGQRFSSLFLRLRFRYSPLSLASTWSSGSSQSCQIMFRRSKRSYGNATRTIANDLDDWDDLDRLDRVEFYPDDRDDRVNFDAIIWKRAQTTETIGTIEGYSRNRHFYSSNRDIIWSGWPALKSKKRIQNAPKAYGRYLKLEKVRDIKFSTWYYTDLKLG